VAKSTPTRDAARATHDDDEPVPRLPRTLHLRFSGPELFRIALTLGMLVAVVMLAKPCGNAVSTFVMGFEGSAGSGSAHGSAAKPDPYEHLTPGMSDEEVRQAIERAKARNATGSGAGSGAAGSAVYPMVNATIGSPNGGPIGAPAIGSATGSAASRAPANGSAAGSGSAAAAEATRREMMQFHMGGPAAGSAAGSAAAPKRIDPTQLQMGGSDGVARPTGSP
jgi:hypothetical protein